MIYQATLFVTFLTFSAFGLTGIEIIQKMDLNRSFSSISYDGRMTIYSGTAQRTKHMHVQALGKNKKKAIVEFTNPEDEGTKYLLLDNNLWIYFPLENDIVKISGHLLKEGMMGSDVSYEDALNSDELSTVYSIVLIGKEFLNTDSCYVVELNALAKNVPYYKRKMWVQLSTFVQMREEMYAKSGKLLKVSTTLAIDTIGNRFIASSVEIASMLKKNSKTVFEMSSIVFDDVLDESKFSLRFLRQ